MSSLESHPVQLPGNRAYPSQVYIRQFGREEVAGYDRLRRTGNEPALRALIGSTVQGTQVEDLYEPDFLHLMMWHRVNSFMNFPMKLPWTCPVCEAKNEDKLDLSAIIAEELPADYDVSGNTLDMPCGIPLTLRLPKVGDEVRARQMLSALQIQNVTDDLLRRSEICQMLEFDNNYNTLDKWEIVNHALTVEDIFAIDGFKQMFAYGPSNRMKCNCSGCGGQQNVGFRFSILEFLPSNYDTGAIRARILSHRPSRDAARRAKDIVLPKTSSIPTSSFEKTGGTSQGAAGHPGQLGQRQGQDPQPRGGMTGGPQLDVGADGANEDALIAAAIKSGMLPPGWKGNTPAQPQQAPRPNPQPPASQDYIAQAGAPGMPISPEMSRTMTGRLLEEVRHEAGQATPPATAGDVVRDR